MGVQSAHDRTFFGYVAEDGGTVPLIALVEDEWLLGARIDGFGSLTTQEALDRVRAYLPGTVQRIRFLSSGYLVAPAVLQQVGAVDGTGHVPLTLQSDDGRTEIVELTPTKGEDPGDERKASLNRGYSVLVPDDPDLPGR
jgi:hypothetical protein